MRRLLLTLVVLFSVAARPPANEDVAKARAQPRPAALVFEAYGQPAFERAAREHRFILIHGAAEWCHWCHVMEETTYRDASVAALVAKRFVAIRVDVDSRPDFMERYSAWGWPATIILNEHAEEVAKYRGYLPPDRMLELLTALEQSAAPVEKAPPPDVTAPPAALPWIAARTLMDLDSFYDKQLGSWGKGQKLSLGSNVEVELLRARTGDTNALQRARFTLTQQRALLDPVWGGVYQYSTGGVWTKPHFEKLMPYQAATLQAYAQAGGQLHDDGMLADARAIHRYLTTFLMDPRGVFYANQDADVGAHDPKATFVDGHVFYPLPDPQRRKKGIPWVDTHVYARENGLAIQALCTLHNATHDDAVLHQARTTADEILRTHARADGSVVRDATAPSQPFFLADVAAFGLGLTRLASITGDARYQAAAVSMATSMLRLFGDTHGAALFDHTPDPDSAGVFSRRAHSFTHNVAAARFLANLSNLTRDPALRDQARAILSDVSTPSALADQGRMLGDYLLALHDVGAWSP